jgi:hypothetical protein
MSRRLLALPLTGILLALAGCGGPVKGAPCPQNAEGASAPAAESASARPSDPAPFQGTFELVSATDGKTTVDFTELFHKSALDGKLLWSVGDGTFSLGVWVVGGMDEKDEGGGELYSFCRGNVTVPARFEGMTLVLPTTLDVKGYSTAVRVTRKHDAGKTTTRTWQSNMDCSASAGALRLGFEVVEKDAEGPVRLRVTSDKGSVELRRAAPIDKLDPREIIQAATAGKK